MWVKSWVRRLRRVPWVTLTMMRALSMQRGCPPHRCSRRAPAHRPAVQSWGPAAGSWDDIVVDKGLQEQACLHIGQRADHDADEHEDAVRQIVLEHLCMMRLSSLPGFSTFGRGPPMPRGPGPWTTFAFCSAITAHLPACRSRRRPESGCCRLPDRSRCSSAVPRGCRGR